MPVTLRMGCSYRWSRSSGPCVDYTVTCVPDTADTGGGTETLGSGLIVKFVINWVHRVITERDGENARIWSLKNG